MQDLMPWMEPWPVWSLYLFMLSAGAILMRREIFARPDLLRPRCPKCGYDRTGLPSPVCPECGHALSRPDDAFRPAPRRWIIALALAIAFALPAFALQRRVRQYGWAYYLRVGPLYWVVGPSVDWAHDVAGYRVEAISDRRAYTAALTRFNGSILRVRRGKKIYFQHARIDHYPLRGIPIGADINGNGWPDLLLESFDTGNASKIIVWHLELRPDEAVLLGAWQGFETRTLNIHGPMRDGTYDLVAYDWTWTDNEHWDSKPVPLTWNGQQYIPSNTPLLEPPMRPSTR